MPQKLRRLLLGVVAAVLAVLSVPASALAASADATKAAPAVADPFTVGYLWNDVPTFAGCRNPAGYWSYNSKGAVNAVCHLGGVGQYEVRFPLLASPGGNVQVTAYGSTPANCKVVSWYPVGSEQRTLVNCFTLAGAALDTHFTASFTAGGGSANTIAFAWAHSPTVASYVPTANYQYNNRGGLATITRHGVGSYTVSFPDGFGPSAAGSVKVTAYGGGTGVCKVGSWGPSAAAELVNVYCHTSAGAASDELFSVVYVNGQNILGDNLLADGYAWGNQPSAASYTPALSYQRSTTVASAGTVTVTRPTVGTYDVFLPHQNQGLDGGHVQATAYGGGTARCQVGFWGPAAGGRQARVYCFTNAGALTDTYFTMQYTAKVQ